MMEQGIRGNYYLRETPLSSAYCSIYGYMPPCLRVEAYRLVLGNYCRSNSVFIKAVPIYLALQTAVIGSYLCCVKPS